MQTALKMLLSGELDFHQENSSYATHNVHSFPAKFPPQLPRKFIEALTSPGQRVLDPMLGSGTTMVESVLTGRRALGYDIDPLALLLCRVKSSPMTVSSVPKMCRQLLNQATDMLTRHDVELEVQQSKRWDVATRRFLDYWFATKTQRELLALLLGIQQIKDPVLRRFFVVSFSATIINRTGGVSLAIDLAHTRPHRAKLALDETGRILHGSEAEINPRRSRRYQVKVLRPVFREFERQVRRNIAAVLTPDRVYHQPRLAFGNAQTLPLPGDSIDLVVTSPPYAANAIDYMRTHKFSLVWLGYSVRTLASWRTRYIGGTYAALPGPSTMPQRTGSIVNQVIAQNRVIGHSLRRYYAEMTRVLQETHRVLKPGRVAIVVVGNSILRGVDTETAACLCEIGESIGFQAPVVAVRQLDRDRRMMPVSSRVAGASGIQRRMHEESVIGFYKPSRPR